MVLTNSNSFVPCKSYKCYAWRVNWGTREEIHRRSSEGARDDGNGPYEQSHAVRNYNSNSRGRRLDMQRLAVDPRIKPWGWQGANAELWGRAIPRAYTRDLDHSAFWNCNSAFCTRVHSHTPKNFNSCPPPPQFLILHSFVIPWNPILINFLD